MTIPTERLNQLKRLFREDGIEISDEDSLEAGKWLIERAQSILGTTLPKGNPEAQKMKEGRRLSGPSQKEKCTR